MGLARSPILSVDSYSLNLDTNLLQKYIFYFNCFLTSTLWENKGGINVRWEKRSPIFGEVIASGRVCEPDADNISKLSNL